MHVLFARLMAILGPLGILPIIFAVNSVTTAVNFAAASMGAREDFEPAPAGLDSITANQRNQMHNMYDHPDFPNTQARNWRRLASIAAGLPDYMVLATDILHGLLGHNGSLYRLVARQPKIAFLPSTVSRSRCLGDVGPSGILQTGGAYILERANETNEVLLMAYWAGGAHGCGGMAAAGVGWLCAKDMLARTGRGGRRGRRMRTRCRRDTGGSASAAAGSVRGGSGLTSGGAGWRVPGTRVPALLCGGRSGIGLTDVAAAVTAGAAAAIAAAHTAAGAHGGR